MRRMGWMLTVILLCLGLMMPFSVSASPETDTADTEEISWVFDDYGLLDETEQTQLNQELADIYDEYGYDAVLLISPDIGEEEEISRLYFEETHRRISQRVCRMKCWITAKCISRQMIRWAAISR